MTLFDSTVSSAAALHRFRPRRGAGAPALVRRWSRREALVASFTVIAAAAVAFGCWLMTDAVVPWDSKNHFYPMFRFLADALHRGEIPLWNPYHFAGHPAAADPQSLLFTPSMVLFALVAPNASMPIFDAVIFAHLVIGGWGFLGLFARRGWHPAGAVLAALVFMLGGAASSRLQHTGMIISYAYFPLALWSLEVALERISYRAALLFGVLGAFMVLGRDQVAFLLALSLIFYVVWAVLRDDDPRHFILGRLGVLALSALVIAAIMAVPTILTLQFLGASNRPEEAFGVAAAGSLAPFNMMTLLAPNFFGSLDTNYDYWGPGYETIADADWTDRAVNYLFVGSLPVLLIAWHGLAGGRLLGRGARFFVLLLATALVYAVGRYTPFFGLVFDWLPGVSLYRRPADATFVVNIALAFGAGFLLHRFVEQGLPRPFRQVGHPWALALTAATLVLLAVLVGYGLTFSIRQHHFAESLRSLIEALAVYAGFALLLYLFSAKARRAIGAMLVVALGGLELVWHNAASSLNAEPAARYDVYATLSPAKATGLAVLRQEMAAHLRNGERPRVEILGLGGAWQNASMLLKLENTLGYNPLRIADYERAVGPGENAGDPNLRHFPGTFRGYRCKLATLLGLQYLVLDRPLTKLPRHFPRPVATLLYAGDSMYVYKLGRVAPRAYFAGEVMPVDSDGILESHVVPDFDRTTQVLIDQRSMDDLDADVLQNERPAALTHTAITAYTDTSVTIDVDTDRAGIVVLHDLYYPGWEAHVDGVKKPVLRANILFRGVEVGRGHHEITFEFRPLSLPNLMAAAGSLLHRKTE